MEPGLIQRIASRLNLRFPWLFVLLAALAGLDLLIPDPLPFVDELGFVLLAALVGTWKQRRR
jgi:hypothetical protein